MVGRDYLTLAREIFSGGSERHWRGALGRAYYALMLECRDLLARWGFVPAPRENVHTFVRLRFVFAADPDAILIGRRLDWYCGLRNRADYDLSTHTAFSSDSTARKAINDVTDALTRLDALSIDAARVASIIADMRSRWP